METTSFVALIASVHKRLRSGAETVVLSVDGDELLDDCSQFETVLLNLSLTRSVPATTSNDANNNLPSLRALVSGLVERGDRTAIAAGAVVVEGWRWRALAILLLRDLAEYYHHSKIALSTSREEICDVLREWMDGDSGHIIALIDDAEERVRMVTADSMCSIVKLLLLPQSSSSCSSSSSSSSTSGLDLYALLWKSLFFRAGACFTRASTGAHGSSPSASSSSESPSVPAPPAAGAEDIDQFRAPLSVDRGGTVYCENASGAFPTVLCDDTSGWGALEAVMKALREMLRGAAAAAADIADNDDSPTMILPLALEPFLRPEAVDLLIVSASQHTNRFVRQDSHVFTLLLMEVLMQRNRNSRSGCSSTSSSCSSSVSDDKLLHLICEGLSRGLQDDWSQIKKAAVLSTRVFFRLKSTEDDEVRRRYVPVLLPALCMSRFYEAEGVKTAALEVWKEAMGSRGKAMYAGCAGNAAVLYSIASRARNHMTSESACHAMAELAAKVDRESVRPHVGTMAAALVSCMQGSSWPVRDAAALAMGTVVRCFPDETLDFREAAVREWLDNLSYGIWSVRDDSAAAVGEAMRCGSSAWSVFLLKHSLAHVRDNLFRALDEQKASQKSFIPADMMIKMSVQPSGTATSGAATGIPSSDSWRGSGWGCCIDCMNPARGRPWEVSTGALCLLREVAAYGEVEGYILQAWSLLKIDNFKECDKLHTAVLEQLPEVVSNSGLADSQRGRELLRGALDEHDCLIKKMSGDGASRLRRAAATDFLLKIKVVTSAAHFTALLGGDDLGHE